MNSPLRIVLAIGAGLAILLVAAWLVLAFIMRGPLAGEHKHDFGVIDLRQEHISEVQHTYRLRNRLNHPLTIVAARPDCGCISVHAEFPLTLAPGAGLELPVTMRLGGPVDRKKTVNIRLDCGDDGLQNLWASVTVRTGFSLPKP